MMLSDKQAKAPGLLEIGITLFVGMCCTAFKDSTGLAKVLPSLAREVALIDRSTSDL